MTTTEILNKIKGMTEQDARAFLSVNGHASRVTKKDGGYFIVTRDFVPNRVNLHVEAGVVTFATVG